MMGYVPNIKFNKNEVKLVKMTILLRDILTPIGFPSD
jgi:hypothetical protein